MGVTSIRPSYNSGATQIAVLWHLKPRVFNLRSWLKEAVRNSGILGVILAIFSPLAYSEGHLIPVLIDIPVVYLSIILGIALSRNAR